MSTQRWYEFTINVTVKTNNGSFPVTYDRQGEFNFCARSVLDAVAIAGHRVKDAASTIDTTRMVEILSYSPVSREVFPLESPGLVSCSEIKSQIEELEYA